MKRILFFVLLLSFVASSNWSVAQPPNQERVEALKVAFITKQLELTSEEAQKFWPIYNGYDQNLRNMLKTSRKNGESEIVIEEKTLELHKKYKPEFLKAISEDKFNKLLKAERTWYEMLRKEWQNRRGGGNPGKQGLE